MIFRMITWLVDNSSACSKAREVSSYHNASFYLNPSIAKDSLVDALNDAFGLIYKSSSINKP